MEPVECYAAKKLVELVASIGSSGKALVELRNLAVFLGQAYGISADKAKTAPEPGYTLYLDTVFLPPEKEEEKKTWKEYRKALSLASVVLSELAKICNNRLASLSESPEQGP